MKITKKISEELNGMEIKKAVWVLERLNSLQVDYPEIHFYNLIEDYEDEHKD